MNNINVYLEHWGWFQVILHFVCCIGASSAGIQYLVYSFTFANPKLRCKYDDEDHNATYSDVIGLSNWTRLFESESQGGYDIYCKYCPDMWNNTSFEAGICGTNFTAQTCHSFIHDTSQYTSTIAMTYNLVCEDGAWKQELAETLFMLGAFMGSALWGVLCDRIGRRPSYIMCSALVLVVTNTQPLLPSFQWICVFQVLLGFSVAGLLIILVTLLMEYSTSKNRSATGGLIEVYYTIGELLLSVLAYTCRDWKILMWTASSVGALFIGTFFLVPESISWLVATGRLCGARTQLNKLWKVNKMQIPDNIKDEILKGPESANVENITILNVFKHSTMTKYTLIVFYTWFAVSMAYFGISLNPGDLPGSIYLNFAILAMVEMIAHLISIPLMNIMGRVPSMYLGMSIGGVALIISSVIPTTSLSHLITALAILGKLGISMAYGVVYVYTVEFFPTAVRSSATGFGSFFAAIGSTGAPQIQLLTIYTANWVPFVIYGGVSLSAGLLIYFLPETNGQPLPQTIDDALRLSNNKRKINPVLELSSQVNPTSGLQL